MSTHVITRGAQVQTAVPATARRQLAWLVAGLALGFVVPFVLADTLELPRDLYYGLYAAAVLSFFALWARSTGQALGEMLRRRWLLTTALALVAGGVLVFIVLGKDATSRPDGIALVAAVLWRGIVYGAVDGLLLSAFPILAVFAMFAGTKTRRRLTGKIAIGFAALVASVALTAVYHVGYSDFRSDKVRQPIAGDVVWSVPTLVTLNPIGAPIAHAAMHTAAVLHSYETDVFLPPHAEDGR